MSKDSASAAQLDHFPEGGINEAVTSALADSACPVHLLAETRKPRRGTPDELLDYEGISTPLLIVEKVRELLSERNYLHYPGYLVSRGTAGWLPKS
ncbi:hypothetical protein [Desulfofustis glycolicus]|uniref:Transketolase n=1 Tax=Desulfofustis glycolicus DSM 9705 TaxID=1121409 RepID=A0A1M5SJQ4_9BACT|nr:hypothetical protein [Desulfofustis glycolicus]MCB2215772.1 hypothetical protein [Desulfobulbaceae bacterium]SHH38719.1 transketolase [Desulfofustis glycolicus DSM 9705]